jgi:multidrug efflux pump subunit AcrA (membrane-fusion protein)
MADELEKDESQNEDEKDEKELEGKETPGEGKEVKKETKKEDKSADVEAYKKAIAEAEIERIRKEEKDKLYASFEKYKEDARKAEDARKVAEDKLKEYETSKLSAEEQAVLKLQQLEESNSRLQEQMESLVEEANSKITTLQLELVKKEVLAQYGDEIIPALVTGSTIEEISESAEKAHREYVSIQERTLAKAKEVGKPKSQIGTGVSPQNDRLNAGVTVADINKVNDPKIWEANRDKFLEEALKQIS